MIEALLTLIGTVVPLAVTAYLQWRKEAHDATRNLAHVEADELDRGMATVDRLRP